MHPGVSSLVAFEWHWQQPVLEGPGPGLSGGPRGSCSRPARVDHELSAPESEVETHYTGLYHSKDIHHVLSYIFI